MFRRASEMPAGNPVIGVAPKFTPLARGVGRWLRALPPARAITRERSGAALANGACGRCLESAPPLRSPAIERPLRLHG
jgi:hypothetical protein